MVEPDMTGPAERNIVSDVQAAGLVKLSPVQGRLLDVALSTE
jgi:hypothetical protein